jgi:hypothetical protein
MAGVLLALGACGQAPAGDPGELTASPSDPGGAVHLAASQTCTPGSVAECQAVGDEHVVVAPSEFTRVGVTTATPAADGSAAVEVVFDAAGAAAFLEASRQAADKGESGRLVLRVDDQVISAVRVPSAVAVTQLHISLPDHLQPQDVVRQIGES